MYIVRCGVAEAHSSSGDPARSIALLWRDPAAVPRRGPARAWDLDAIVDAAIGLADDGGLAAVTIRAVARIVGAAPMSLYTYVPGKAELLDLMLDAVYAAMPRADTAARPWPERVRAVAEENRALFVDHPWAARVSTGRPPLGPRLDRQVRARAGRVRRARPRRRRPRRLPRPRGRVRAGRGARRPGRAGRPGGWTGRCAVVGARRGPCWRGCSIRPPTRGRAGSAAPRARRTAVPPTPTTPTASGSTGSSTGSPPSSSAAAADRRRRWSPGRPRSPVPSGRPPAPAIVAERAPAGPAGRLDALDTEIRRGRRHARPPTSTAADPTADPGGTHDDTAPDDRTA